MPVIGPKTAGMLREFIDHTAPPMPEIGDIENMLARLALVMREGKTTPEEAGARLDLYWRGLRDVSLPALHHAFDNLLATATFFPSVKEIIDATEGSSCRKFGARRNVAKALLLKHDREWRAPVQPIEPAEVSELKAAMASATDALRVNVPAQSPPRAKARYCDVCHLSIDNPAVKSCEQPMCDVAAWVEAAA
jgi:hypothetical protein